DTSGGVVPAARRVSPLGPRREPAAFDPGLRHVGRGRRRRREQQQQRRQRWRASRDNAGPTPQDPLGWTLLAVEAPRRRAGVPVGPPRPLDPLCPSATFATSARFDRDAACSPLSANVRCALASLLRCGSLDLGTLPGHLANREVVSGLASFWGFTASDMEKRLGRAVAEGEVGEVMGRIVEALSWGAGTVPTAARRRDCFCSPAPGLRCSLWPGLGRVTS
ncbi:hypothetical protein THAOC_36899, partial [Thalassiosira oceanica]